METHVSSSSCGVNTPDTAPVLTQDTLGALEPLEPSPVKPKPKAKARLLFNTDGSVKLLGDPSLFPGSGIDSNSHSLVPTVGPDGKMTMLLTPLGPQGKTFILNPTNGCSLPKTFPLLKPSQQTTSLATKTTDDETVPTLTNSSGPSRVVTSKSFKPNPVIIKTSEFKSNSQQKSLLSGVGKPGTVDSTSQYVTHMRIDPSGACTSTVNVPVTGEQHKSGSSTLKAIADKIDPENSTQTNKSFLSNILGDTAETKTVVHDTKSTSTRTFVIAPNGKMVQASNSHWTHLSSVSPNIAIHLSQDKDLPQNRLTQTKSNEVPPTRNVEMPKGVYPPRIVSPITSTIRLPAVPRLPAVTADKPMTYILIPPAPSGSSRSGQQSLISASNLLSSKTLGGAQQFKVSDKTQVTAAPPKWLYKTLSSEGQNKFVVYPTKSDPGLLQPPLVSETVKVQSYDSKSINQDKTSEAKILDPSTDDSKSLLNLDKTHEEATLDPIIGLSASSPEEDDSLCIKIDSVFSLSTKNETQGPSAIDLTEEAVDSGSGEVLAKVEAESSQSEPKTITCNPAYVVLDRLSQHQIAHHKTSIVKCSDYCRTRTLNFLCTLDLVDCEPIVHTINLKQDTLEKDHTDSISEDNDSSQADVKCQMKRKLENENSDQTCKFIKKDSNSEDQETISKASGQTENKTDLRVEGSPPSLNVRKVESPGSAKTKLLKFTKVEKEQVKSVVMSDSKKVNHQTNVVSKPVLSPPKLTPFTVKASEVMTGMPPLQLGVQSSVPITKVQDNTKKQYFLFNVDGQNILVPTSNNMQKPKAFMLKGSGNKTPPGPACSKLPPALRNVSLLNRTIPPKVTSVANPLHLNQKRPLEVTISHEDPKNVLKPETQKKEEIIPGIRIKSEPITHGYGDEEPIKPKSKKSKVKVKKEPVDNEWQEIWSSSSNPVADPNTIPKTKPKTIKTSSKVSEQKSTQGTEQSPGSPEMPDLPMMRVPSSEEIAKSSATHNDRIERLKALLKSKEKLIEDLKEKRLKEGNILDDELFADSGPPLSPVNNHWDSNTGQTITEDTSACATVEDSSELDKIGSSDTESCEPCWSSFDVNDDIN